MPSLPFVSHQVPELSEEMGRRYRLEGVVGSGGMGAVWLAYDKELGRKCAVKVAAGAGAERDRFTREARIGARLDGNGTAVVYNVAQLADGKTPLLVLEFVDGKTFAELVVDAPLAWRDALGLVRRAALALAPAHATGIVHRDVKPANLILRASGEVKVIDYGLGHLPGAPPLTVDGLLGTPRYMAPEQASAPSGVDARADIYSLGVVLYELVAGANALAPRDTGAALHTRPAKWPQLPDLREKVPGVPAQVARVVARATERNRKKRYAAVEDLVAAIDACLASPEGVQVKAPAVERRRAWLALGVVAVVSGAVAGGAAVIQWAPWRQVAAAVAAAPAGAIATPPPAVTVPAPTSPPSPQEVRPSPPVAPARPSRARSRAREPIFELSPSGVMREVL